MSTIKRFFHYWCEILSGSKEQHERIISVLVGVSAFLGWLGYVYNWNVVITGISASSAVALTLRALFWLPFLKYEKAEAEIKSLSAVLGDKTAEKQAAERTATLLIEKRNHLAKCQRDINNLLDELRASGRGARSPELVSFEERRKSGETVQTICNLLKDHVGQSEAERFRNAKPQEIPAQYYQNQRNFLIATLEAKFAKLEQIEREQMARAE